MTKSMLQAAITSATSSTITVDWADLSPELTDKLSHWVVEHFSSSDPRIKRVRCCGFDTLNQTRTLLWLRYFESNAYVVVASILFVVASILFVVASILFVVASILFVVASIL